MSRSMFVRGSRRPRGEGLLPGEFPAEGPGEESKPLAMKRLGIGLLFAVGGYAIAAFAGYFLIGWLSSNRHDRTVEAAMTSVFVAGPVGAVVAFLLGFVRGPRASSEVSAKR